MSEILSGIKLLEKVADHLDQLRERLDATRGDMLKEAAQLTTPDLARFFVQAKLVKDALEELEKSVNPFHMRFKEVLIPDRFEAEGITSLPLEGVGRVGVSQTVRASIDPTLKDAAFEWLRSNDKDIVQETVNASTLGALAKTVLEDEGKDLPERAGFRTLLVWNGTFTRTAQRKTTKKGSTD